MPSRKRRSTARRSDFVEGEDFAKAIYFGGGPGFGEIDDLAHLPGEYGEVMRAVWGSSQAEFEAEVEAQYQREQEERPPGAREEMEGARP